MFGWIRERFARACDIERAREEPEVNGFGSTTLIGPRKTHPKVERQ